MTILKYLLSCFLLANAADLSDGWYPIEKVKKGLEQAEELDPEIWSLFVKRLKNETFQVRFPVEPVYRYLENGDFEVSAVSDDGACFLTVKSLEGPDYSGADFLYENEGKFVREHFVRTEGYFYHFKTVRSALDPSLHDEFISSFFIEENR